MSTEKRNQRRELTGVVDKKSGSKTIRILVENLKRHALYGKVYRVSSTYLAHDEKEEASVGDKVTIASCRPISKQKKWRLLNILEKKK